MADFEKALKKVLVNEGGYVNHVNDPGGETYCGITRKNYPDWPGWSVIDGCASKNDFPAEVSLMVADFYRKNYWDKVNGFEFSQIIAEELFDCSVNVGISKAVKILQETINLLGRDGISIEVDGALGRATMAAYSAISGASNGDVLHCMKALRAGHYLDICRKNPTLRVFLRGWLNRVF